MRIFLASRSACTRLVYRASWPFPCFCPGVSKTSWPRREELAGLHLRGYNDLSADSLLLNSVWIILAPSLVSASTCGALRSPAFRLSALVPADASLSLARSCALCLLQRLQSTSNRQCRKIFDKAQCVACQIKALREITGAGITDCKNALNTAAAELKTGENLQDKAAEILRKKGVASAAKKAGDSRSGLAN